MPHARGRLRRRSQDEYDRYVGEIYVGLLARKASDQEITARLLNIVQERMGLDTAKAEDMQPTVRALREIRL
jgi:hypothetical protein